MPVFSVQQSRRPTPAEPNAAEFIRWSKLSCEAWIGMSPADRIGWARSYYYLNILGGNAPPPYSEVAIAKLVDQTNDCGLLGACPLIAAPVDAVAPVAIPAAEQATAQMQPVQSRPAAPMAPESFPMIAPSGFVMPKYRRSDHSCSGGGRNCGRGLHEETTSVTRERSGGGKSSYVDSWKKRRLGHLGNSGKQRKAPDLYRGTACYARDCCDRNSSSRTHDERNSVRGCFRRRSDGKRHYLRLVCRCDWHCRILSYVPVKRHRPCGTEP